MWNTYEEVTMLAEFVSPRKRNSGFPQRCTLILGKEITKKLREKNYNLRAKDANNKTKHKILKNEILNK